MRLILVRHGETHENLRGITQGTFNSQLTEKGVAQAIAVAKRLKTEKIDYIYSSDLDRAKYTAEEILKYHPNVPLELRTELREQSKGIYEGKPREVSHKELDRQGIEWHEFHPEGGESYQQLQERLIIFYEEIKNKHQKDSVLIVSHGGPFASLLCYLNNEPLSEFRNYVPENTAVTVLDFSDQGNFDFINFNCTEHLRTI